MIWKTKQNYIFEFDIIVSSCHTEVLQMQHYV